MVSGAADVGERIAWPGAVDRVGEHRGDRRDPLASLPYTTNVDTTGSDTRATGTPIGRLLNHHMAFVPLTPNEDTPARRGSSVAGHSMSSVAI